MVYAPKQTVIICDDKKKPEAMKCITAMEDVTKGQAEVRNTHYVERFRCMCACMCQLSIASSLMK